MGSLLPVLLLALPAAAYPGSRSPSRRWTVRAPAPTGGPPTRAGTSAPFWVRLSPEHTAVRPGGTVWLNCSSSCPLPEDWRLRSLLRRGNTLQGPGWVSYQLLDVRAWSSVVHCFVTCAGQTRGATARITTYKGPRSVILEPPVWEGGEYRLRCHVTHVFPVGFLAVTLRRGDRLLYSETLERFTGLDLANVTLTYVLRTGPLDLGLPVTCHAHLNLDGLVIRSSSAPVMLTALAWHLAPQTLASLSIVALAGILLLVGVAYLRKRLLMQPRA